MKETRALILILIACLTVGLLSWFVGEQDCLRIEEYEDGSFELFRAGKHIGSGCLDDQPCQD